MLHLETRLHRNTGGRMEERTKLIQARARKYWTQEQAAGFIGVDVGTYRKWERGIVIPRSSSIQQLCDAFKMGAEELGLDRGLTEIPSLSRYDALISNNLALRLQALGFQSQSFMVVQSQITTILKEYDTMNRGDNDYQITRRQALLCLAGLPFIASLRDTASALRNPGEVITQCAASLTSCWILSKSSYEEDLHQAFDIASAFIPILKDIVRDATNYCKDAAILIAQCSLLKTVLGWHFEGLKAASIYAQDAVIYAKRADNVSLQATGLDFLAWIYYYGRRIKQAENVSAEAFLLVNSSDTPSLFPLLCSRVYGTRALILAKSGKDSAAMLDRASNHFFRTPKDTSEFFYLDYDEASLMQSGGMARYHQGKQDEAMTSFKQIIEEKTLLPKVSLSERTKVETLNLMALSSLKQPDKDKQETLHYWEAAILGARAIQSEQFFNEAVCTYEIMSVLWSDDNYIKKELAEFTIHW